MDHRLGFERHVAQAVPVILEPLIVDRGLGLMVLINRRLLDYLLDLCILLSHEALLFVSLQWLLPSLELCRPRDTSKLRLTLAGRQLSKLLNLWFLN